jgi:hypothetical protein
MNDTRLITGPEDLYPDGANSVSWVSDPVFEFTTEIDALRTLQLLGDDLQAARREVENVLRYMAAAARAAHQGTHEDGPVSAQAIINETGTARQTVYNWIS